jgi:hypothetical protein
MGANIPLPALSIQPPQQQDPLTGISRLVALRDAMQRSKLLPLQQQALTQENQARGQENQLRSFQIQDQQTLRQAAKGIDWSKDDAFDKLVNAAQSGGVSPQTLQSIATTRQAFLRSVAETDEATNKATLQRNNLLLGQVDALANIKDPAKRAQQAPQWAAGILSQKGLVRDAQTAQQLQAVANGQYQPTDDDLQMLRNHLTDHNTQIETTLKQAQTTEANSRAGEAEAQTRKINAEIGTGELAYRQTLAKLNNGEQVSPQEVRNARAFEFSDRKTNTQSDSLGISSTTTSQRNGLDAALASYRRLQGQNAPGASSPGAIAGSGGTAAGGGQTPSPQSLKQTLVDTIGKYDYDPAKLSRMLIKHPDIIAMVKQQYPGWSDTDYNAKNKMVQSYTSGPESRSINAISTALGHSGELGLAIDALNNGDAGLKTLRGLANRLGVEVGSDAVTTFKTIVHRLAPEITAAYVQGGGGEGERMAAEKDFDPSLGGQQLRSNLGITVKLLRSKIAAQEQQWNTTYKPTRPGDAFATRFLTPGAKQTLDKWSPENQPQGGGPGASASKPGKVISMSQLQQAAKDHGVSVDEAKRQAQTQGYTIQ